jgi:hypothetical protein
VKVLLAWAALAAVVYVSFALLELVLVAVFSRLKGRRP